MPRARRADDYPYFDNGGLPLAFAHRGGRLQRDDAPPENTMAAFQAAIDLGYRYLETDVHSTSDGALVVHHDPVLGGLVDGTDAIAVLTAEQVGRHRVGAEPVPSFDDVLGTWPDVRVNVDAKSPRSVALLNDAINRHRAWDRVCVASFSALSTRAVRATVDPRVATSFSRVGVAALIGLPVAALRRLLLAGGQVAQVPVRRGPLEIINARFIERAHAAGKQVHAWTIDDPVEAGRLLDLGVDAIMADHIEALRDVYRARGIWRD